MRARKLKADPYCQCPHHQEKKVPADTVDHIEPHRGDRKLFFKYSNLQSMTRECHDIFKQSQEKGGAGFDAGCSVDGSPLNPGHSWYE